MKHTYKSMLFAAMALAAGTAGYFSSSGNAFWRDEILGGQKPATSQEQLAGLSPAAIDGIKEMIAKQEYDISYDDVAKSLQSPNRRQNLRAYYKPGKLTIQNRVDSAGHNFKLHLINEGIFADGKRLYSPQSDAAPTNSENRLLIDHKGFTEEFINTEDGVRENFIVKTAPKNTASLQVRLSAKGLKAQNGSENEIRFSREDGKGNVENCLVFSDLHCWDANKKPLAATLAYANNRVEINVNVEDAAYPVTIDPIVANGTPNNVNKTLESEQSYAWLGFSVASAGDVNKDGYSDIIVGAPKYDWNGEDAGAAFVFPGSPSGILLTSQRLNRNQPFAQMGYSVSSAGDVNKDGYSDVIVGSPYWEDSPAQNNEGAAFLYFGGPVTQASPIGINAGSWITFQSDQAESGFGISVAMAGDVNADGWSDFMVGAHLYDKGENNEGVAFLYYGANSGYDASKTEIIEANQADAMFGAAIAGAGDINADGASDIVIGSRLYDINQNKTNEGAAFVYKGSINSTPVTASQPQIIPMTQAESRFGHSVSTAGDVNGDGYADIAIGAYNFDGGLIDEGAVYIHHGGPNGINVVADKVIESNQQNAQLGWAVASAGDVNGDGYGDVVVGARYFDNNQVNEGAAFVYHGSSVGLNVTAASMIESNQGDAWLGSAVSSAGDVNGDGYSDILIGSYAFDHGQTDEGQVFVYHGSPSNIGPVEKSTLNPLNSGALGGSSVSNAGDVDGDGLDDIVIGAPNYDGGQAGEGAAFINFGNAALGTNTVVTFQTNEVNAHVGSSVSTAGDVNGDGYDDVIVGATGALSGAQKGAAYVLHGTSGGINVAAPAKTLFWGNQGLGTSVSDAGDINRDGFDDVIVGAPLYSTANANLCGAVMICMGSGNGIITPGTIVTSGQANAKMGNSLAGAGDLNGDGYSDFAVGASAATYQQNGEGVVYIWHGSSAGIASNAVYNKLFESNQVDAQMGISVAGAGDVNADGFDDLIVGSHMFDNGQGDEGIAAVYYGSSTGCSSANKTILEVNQNLAFFGKSVAGAGDVNADGYADVIVGAPYYDGQVANGGGVWVFPGTISGISNIPLFSATGPQVEAHMGEAVSGAGDLNGDGYSDIIVGMPDFDENGVNNSGVAWAYFGSNGLAGKNKRNNLRLYNEDLVSIMNLSQDVKEKFGLGLYPTSFLGRNNGRLAWDLAKFGESFSKDPNPTSPVTNSVFPDLTENSYTAVPSTGQLKEVINKPLPSYTTLRVRARIKFELATALTGQVYGPWRYLPGYVRYVQPPQATRENMGDGSEIETAMPDATPEYKDQVSVYPNPVTDRLFIQSTNMDQVSSLQLISANGTMAFTSMKPQGVIDVKHLAAGSYVLLINRKDGSKTSHKVLINK